MVPTMYMFLLTSFVSLIIGKSYLHKSVDWVGPVLRTKRIVPRTGPEVEITFFFSCKGSYFHIHLKKRNSKAFHALNKKKKKKTFAIRRVELLPLRRHRRSHWYPCGFVDRPVGHKCCGRLPRSSVFFFLFHDRTHYLDCNLKFNQSGPGNWEGSQGTPQFPATQAAQQTCFARCLACRGSYRFAAGTITLSKLMIPTITD